MNIDRLLTLRELARCGTMAAAAQSTHLRPSAVSQHITQPGRDVTAKLTERRGRGVAHTPAGFALVHHAERVMAARSSVAGAVLPATVVATRMMYPRLDVIIREMTPREGLAALNARQADVAVIDDLAVDQGLRHDAHDLLPLVQDALQVVLPASYPLVDRPFLRIPDLRDEDSALDFSSDSFDEFMVDRYRRAGFEPRVGADCTGFELVAAMVASGCPVWWASRLHLVGQLGGIKTVCLRPRIQRRAAGLPQGRTRPPRRTGLPERSDALHHTHPWCVMEPFRQYPRTTRPAPICSISARLKCSMPSCEPARSPRPPAR